LSGDSTLYVITGGTRRSSNGYTTHEFEVVLSRSRSVYTVEMRSRIRYIHSDNGVGTPWASRATFDARADAEAHVAAVLADPGAFGETNRDERSTRYYWDREQRRSRTMETMDIYRRPAGLDNGSLADEAARGRGLPDGLVAGEVARQLWGRSEPQARAALLGYVGSAPLTYGQWSHWKWLYKKAEETDDTTLLGVMIPRLEAVEKTPANQPVFEWTKTPPGRATMAHMVRRARRFMRVLAERDPAAYVALALAVLRGANDRKELTPQSDWASFDILYGGSNRWVQAGHGRGAYTQRRRLSLRVPDERVPVAWDAQVNALWALYGDARLPWQTLEWVQAMLTRRGVSLPALGDDVLIRYLESSSPLLIRTASRQVAARLAPGDGVGGRLLGPRLLALAFWRGSGVFRSRIAAAIRSRGRQDAWDETFAKTLAELFVREAQTPPLSRRLVDIALLLAMRYGSLSAPSLMNALPALLAAERDELTPLIAALVERYNPYTLYSLLLGSADAPPSQREALANAVLGLPASWWRNAPSYPFIQLVEAPDPFVRDVGWRIVEVIVASGSERGRGLAEQVWEAILVRAKWQPATLPGALASAAALRLLGILPEILAQVVELLRTTPALLTALSGEGAEMMVRHFPSDVLFALIPLIGVEEWPRLRDLLLDSLRADGRLGALWRAAADRDADPALAARLAGDPVAAATFAEVADVSYLDSTNPSLEPLLLAWLEGHHIEIGRGSPALLTLVTHKAPSLRAWGLRRLDDPAMGLTVPFALRLLESGLPETIAAGRAYFDAWPHGAPDELDVALAICDSPHHSVQVYGRVFLAARAETLPADELAERLAEHPDPYIQEEAARRLAAQPRAAATPSGAAFDKAVLRSRDRGRRAKELVKARLDAAPRGQATDTPRAPDVRTLLELARGQTPRDREWALQQLARFALDGTVLDGVDISGVEGV